MESTLTAESERSFGRRSFLKGLALASAGAASVAIMPGCSAPKERTSESLNSPVEAEAGSSPAVQLRANVAQQLNPQRDDFRTNTTDMSHIFSEFKLGTMTIPNRFVKSSGSTGFWDTGTDGAEPILEYYMNMVNNGCKLILTECFTSYFTEYPASRKPTFEQLDFLPEVISKVHEAGGYLVYQMDTMSTKPQSIPYELTTDELKTLIQDSINCAVKCEALGFDGVEINVGARNVGAALLSRADNTRTDEFSAETMENRTRFCVEILKGIREKCSKDFYVQVLMNAIEENDMVIGRNTNRTTVEEGIEIAKVFQAAGANGLHLRIGPLMHQAQFLGDLYWAGRGIVGTTSFGTQFDFSRHWEGMIQSDTNGVGFMLPLVAAYKKALDIPVGAASYMDPAIAPDMFDNAIANGELDFMVLNRPLNVDPAYVAKLQEGRIDEIRPCTRCVHCFFDFENPEMKIGMRCRQNPCTRRAWNPKIMSEGFTPTKTDSPKNVMVIGGGPGGVEAATVAAERGHKVTLYEKKGTLGGLVSFANNVKGPHENLSQYLTYMPKSCDANGVTVVTDTEVDADFVKSEKPDEVVVAVGGVRASAGLEGTDKTPVIPITEAITQEFGDNVTIMGGNVQALDLAWYLLEQGKNITMVMSDPLDKLGKGQSKTMLAFTTPMLYNRGSRVWDQSKIAKVGNGEVTITNSVGVNITVPCDAVIDAIDMQPNADFVKSIEATGIIPTFAIGDCANPYNILEAVHAGNNVARRNL